jgi:hypothetical protein
MNRGIRTRPVGSNILSDRYTLPQVVDTAFRDLALFIAHTGFTNIRTTSFRSHFTQVVCPSLELAWRLVDQGVLNPLNELWYLVHLRSFVLVVQEPVSAGTRQLFQKNSDDDLGPYDVLFRPPPIAISVDAFIERAIVHYVQKTLGVFRPFSWLVATYGRQRVLTCVRTFHRTAELHQALLLLFPSLALSRSTVYNRISKKKKGCFFSYHTQRTNDVLTMAQT